jgi:APA family basic amino acid/polyamine antiporter
VSTPQGGFRRVLSTWDATMVVVGGIIGAGIFINPYIVARSLDSTVAVIAAWVTGGLIALAGRLRLRGARCRSTQGRRAIRLSA